MVIKLFICVTYVNQGNQSSLHYLVRVWLTSLTLSAKILGAGHSSILIIQNDSRPLHSKSFHLSQQHPTMHAHTHMHAYTHAHWNGPGGFKRKGGKCCRGNSCTYFLCFMTIVINVQAITHSHRRTSTAALEDLAISINVLCPSVAVSSFPFKKNK